MVHKCMHVPAMAYLKYEVTAGVHVRMYVCVQRECPRVCVFVSERERRRRERGSLSPRKSVKNSPGLCPVERFMNLSIGRVCAQLCAHVHAQWRRRAFMSMFKLSI